MAQVVVVGAGVAGLAAAVWLADFGHDVVILERRDRPGGQLTAAAPGPTTLTVPAVLRDLFGKTGRRLDRELTLRPVDPAVVYVTSLGPVAFPHASRGGTLAAIRAAFGDTAADQWDRLLRRAADIWALTRPVLVDRPASRHAIAALGVRRDSRAAAFGTLQQLVRSLDITHPAVTEILAAQATMVGADPHSGPATIATRPYLEQTFGVWAVDGGPAVLVDALVRRAHERGAIVRTGTAATRYEVRRGRIVAVHTAEHERLAADTVISAVPDAAHRRLLGRPVSAGPGIARSVATIVLPDAGPARIDADAVDADLLRVVTTPTADAPLCVVTIPRGGEIVVHADVERDVRADDRWADAIIAGLSDRGLSLGSRDADSRRRIHTPDDWAHDVSLGPLSPHGPSVNGHFAALRRSRSTTRTRGLYRVGAAVGPGPGIHAVALSAAGVADLVGRPARPRTTP